MWGAVIGWLKALLSGKSAMQIGKGNRTVSSSSTGDHSPVVTAGRDVNVSISAGRASDQISGGSVNAAARPRHEELLDWIRAYASEKPLSHVLPRALQLAQTLANRDLERWVRLELCGYNRDGAMSEGDIVPEYRRVPGRYIDENNQVFEMDDAELCEIYNAYRLRYDVSTLEEFAKRTEMIHIADPRMLNLIHKYHPVQLRSFRFHPLEVVRVMNVIRNHLLEKINGLEKPKI